MNKYLLLLFSIFFTTLISAQEGLLDVYFGEEGISLYDASNGNGTDEGVDIVVLEDGKLLISAIVTDNEKSNIAVLRYDSEGAIDPTYASNGKYTYENALGNDTPAEILIDGDGNTLVLGSIANDDMDDSNISFGILKLDPDGKLISGFGSNGIFTHNIDVSGDYATDMYFNSAGQIIIVGNSSVPNVETKNLVVVRVNSDGTLDETFGNAGQFVFATDNQMNEINTVLLDANDDIFVGGYVHNGTNQLPVIHKILADGSGLDVSFGTDGATAFTMIGNIYSMIWDKNGHIACVGLSQLQPNYSEALTLFSTKSGSLNPTYHNSAGYANLFIFRQSTRMKEIIQLSNGKFIIGGGGENGGFRPGGHAVVRFLESGGLDTTWGNGGYAQISTSRPISYSNGMDIQEDGKIVLTGASNTPGEVPYDVSLLRYLNASDIDADDDGYFVGVDCDDDDASVFQGKQLYVDADGDSYHSDEGIYCYGEEIPDGFVEFTSGEDCDDDDSSVYNEDLFYIDLDGDNFDNGEEILCVGFGTPTGYNKVSYGSDCDDNDASVFQDTLVYVDFDEDGYTSGEILLLLR